MKKNLFDFTNENVDEVKKDTNKDVGQKIFDDVKNLNEDIKQEASELYNKYKNYSQNELINEFISTSKQKIKQGSLSKESLRKTLNTILPYINDEQKTFFDNLINSIDD